MWGFCVWSLFCYSEPWDGLCCLNTIFPDHTNLLISLLSDAVSITFYNVMNVFLYIHTQVHVLMAFCLDRNELDVEKRYKRHTLNKSRDPCKKTQEKLQKCVAKLASCLRKSCTVDFQYQNRIATQGS